MKNWISAGLTVVGAVGLVGAVVLAFYWLFWMLWCWVVPALWTSGPENIIRPGYWLFVGVCLLISFVGGLIFKWETK